MKTFEEVLKIIEDKSVEHAAKPDDDFWLCELIELEVFLAIIEFSLSEGFSVECCDLETFIAAQNNTPKEAEEDIDLWSLMEEILHEMDELQSIGSIPQKTQQLYTFWQQKFWP